MSAISRSVVGGVCSIVVTVSAATVLWIDKRTLEVAPELRGSFFSRLQEIVTAMFISKEIIDQSVGDRHVELVATMSSRYFPKQTDIAAVELIRYFKSYHTGYLFKTTKGLYSNRPLVFRLIAAAEGIERFIFSGDTATLFDPVARKEILAGNYLRSSSVLPMKECKNKDGYRQVEIIIAATQDYKKIEDLKNEFFRAFVRTSASKKGFSDHKHPFADTPVFEINKRELTRLGDVANLSPSVKKKIRKMNCISIRSAWIEKTRLSNKSFKEVGVVIVGSKEMKYVKLLVTIYKKHLRKEFLEVLMNGSNKTKIPHSDYVANTIDL